MFILVKYVGVESGTVMVVTLIAVIVDLCLSVCQL